MHTEESLKEDAGLVERVVELPFFFLGCRCLVEDFLEIDCG